MASSQKRLRDDVSAGAASDADSPDSTLTVGSRSPAPSNDYNDARLCTLSCSIASAMDELDANAAAAQAKLEESRATLLAAVNSRYDELCTLIVHVAATKKAALEAEHCVADGALAALRGQAVSAPPFAALEQHGHTTAVELPCMELKLDLHGALETVASLGRILAPRPLSPSGLTLAAHRTGRAEPGTTTTLRIGVTFDPAPGSSVEMRLSLVAGATAVEARALLVIAGSAPLDLPVVPAVSLEPPGLILTIAVPGDAPDGARVVVGSVSIFGQAIRGEQEITVKRGIPALVELVCTLTRRASSVSVSSTGEVFVAMSPSRCVVQLSHSGTEWSSREAPIPRDFNSVVTVCSVRRIGVGSTLLVGGGASIDDVAGSCVAAYVGPGLDFSWSTRAYFRVGLDGIAALPQSGVFFAPSSASETLCAFRIRDGALVNEVAARGIGGGVAVDVPSQTVFVSTPGPVIQSFRWVEDKLVPGGDTTAVGALGGGDRVSRHIAVVPAAVGRRLSHLVVATSSGGGTGHSELCVLALPALTVVHTHRLEGVEVDGLAADPWGGALVVCTSASVPGGRRGGGRVIVLAWPLVGMRQLE